MDITISANRNSSVIIINNETTLKELLSSLGNVTREEKMPTPKKLSETGGVVVARADGCIAYSCGYAVYDNGSGRTVMWLPDCVSFTYHFDESYVVEKGVLPDKDTLPEGMLETLPWVMVVTLIGEHRIESDSMNRIVTGTMDYYCDDRGHRDGTVDATMEKNYEKVHVWREEQIGESPETIFIREETRREMLERMTEKQREVFLLYYYDGLNQREISEFLAISRETVNARLQGALKKVQKIF